MDIKSPVAEARNTYTYAADGRKLKVVQKWNSNYSTNPVIGSAINVSSLNNTKTTEYVGNMIYEGTEARAKKEGAQQLIENYETMLEGEYTWNGKSWIRN